MSRRGVVRNIGSVDFSDLMAVIAVAKKLGDSCVVKLRNRPNYNIVPAERIYEYIPKSEFIVSIF